ncbi:MAG: B12-binding domain-containing protein, partial [Clostridiales bacterium]|nr:B12-binding domain-containing protein [Clostridiales bacterium]
MSILAEISTLLQQGRAPKVKSLVEQALNEGIPTSQILEEGLLAGMNTIGQKFKNNEVFVPEVLIAARAMNRGVEVLHPFLVEDGVEEKGTVVIGTIKGDLHDIGKNLVRMM